MDVSLSRWDQMQALLVPQHPIPAMQKSGGAVEFWREWSETRQRAVWTKTYRNGGGYELDAFNQAEVEMLVQLAQQKVPGTYRPALIQRDGTPFAPAGNGMDAAARYTIKTDDAGPTLEDWLNAPVTAQSSQGVHAHCLVLPESFLQLAQTLLSVLEGVHANNFVHCDLHPANIALPVRLVQQESDGLSIELVWERLTLIDFGYSINRRNPPRTTLPFKKDGDSMRISAHLASMLGDIECQTMAHLKGSERWEDVWLKTAFWQRWQGTSPLERFKDLDWREDLYQVGCLLADIRDGTGMASQLEGRTVQESTVPSVNQVIDQLPDQLKSWGQGVGTPEPGRPHRDYINHIGWALAQARQHGRLPQSGFQLRQRDYPASEGKASFVPLSAVPGVARATPTPMQSRPIPPQLFAPVSAARTAYARKQVGIDLPALQILPPGSFSMGSEWGAGTQPVHTVQIQPPPGLALAVARHALSRAQWNQAHWHNSGLHQPPDSASANCHDLPMVNISWHDCQAYLDTLNHLADLHRQPKELHYRLLSEAEWEYAARAGTTEVDTGRYWWGQRDPDKTEGLAPIMHGEANQWGLSGMVANAWEWLADQHHPSYTQAPQDGSAWCQNSSSGDATAWYQVRGGSWATPADATGLAARASHPADWRSPFIGFRIARWVETA